MGGGTSRPLTPHGPAQVLSHTGPSHPWGHMYTKTHRQGMMAMYKVLSSELGHEAGGPRERDGDYLSRLTLISENKLENGFNNMEHIALAHKEHTLLTSGLISRSTSRAYL